MTRRVAVVTDSTSTLPDAIVTAREVTVVPLQVIIGSRSFGEGEGADAATVAEALRARTPVSTSRPAPETFAAVYERAAADGAEAVVSIHLSGELSGTYESAQVAARTATIPVETVDTRQLGMGIGYAVVSALDALDAGAGATEAAEAARRRAAATTALFYVDTLDHLRRGGRIGAAAKLVGSAFAVKPLLRIDDGCIVGLEKVRTAARAVSRLEDLAVETAGSAAVDLAVAHLANTDRAAHLAERLRERVPGMQEMVVGEVGAVIGAHVGPGMLAVVVAPRR
ncbi:MAG TPA: DegV family protein [Nocardioidaceae bacterium]|nr:DegV family protein [Nocardioidaceae bacterium]